MSTMNIIVGEHSASGTITMPPGEIVDWAATYTIESRHGETLFTWCGVRPLRLDDAGTAIMQLPPCKPGHIVLMPR